MLREKSSRGLICALLCLHQHLFEFCPQRITLQAILPI